MGKARNSREDIEIRFRKNMERIGAISRFLSSEVDGLKQTNVFQSEGIRADILRAVVVFLHATLEDFARSHLPEPTRKFGFYSQEDIRNAITKMKLNPELFADILPPLTQLARRRNQIVHHADLEAAQNDGAEPWRFADDWQLIQWHFAVLAFYHRVRKATGPTNVVEDRARQNVNTALIKNVEVARAALEFAKLAPEQRYGGLQKIQEALRSVQETMRLDVTMFLGPDEKPTEPQT